jgi:hypothetical protein
MGNYRATFHYKNKDRKYEFSILQNLEDHNKLNEIGRRVINQELGYPEGEIINIRVIKI